MTSEEAREVILSYVRSEGKAPDRDALDTPTALSHRVASSSTAAVKTLRAWPGALAQRRIGTTSESKRMRSKTAACGKSKLGKPSLVQKSPSRSPYLTRYGVQRGLSRRDQLLLLRKSTAGRHLEDTHSKIACTLNPLRSFLTT